MEWKEFEKQVAELFRIHGYIVEANTMVSNSQTDVLAISNNRLKPNILIECKHHETKTNVGIKEATNFVARVVLLRIKGTIDHGYLITNTDFTPDAKEFIQKDYSNFVFFRRYSELLSQLADVESYLQEYVKKYEATNQGSSFINLFTPTVRQMKEISFDFSVIQNWQIKSGVNFIDLSQEFLESESKVLILLGDYGSGKTTSMAQLMYTLAKKKLNDPQNSKLRIPLLINLRDHHKVADFNSLLSYFFTAELGNSNLNLELFKKLNDLGTFTLLLDGFDEMAKIDTDWARRHTFIEIAKTVTPRSRVFLTTRPGYFLETKELVEIVNDHLKFESSRSYSFQNLKMPVEVGLACFQLMTDEQLKVFSKTTGRADAFTALINSSKDIKDLARRPVLANMIGQTLDELREKNFEITAKKLFDIYTSQWIKREYEKGKFRMLMSSETKLRFMVSLAVLINDQNASIHYTVINSHLRKYFDLRVSDLVDPYSHDIRTCSFLSRDDTGNYSFIHRSFMDYFLAKDLGLFEKSLYIESHKKNFSLAAINFIDEASAPDPFQRMKRLLFEVSQLKLLILKKQLYQRVAETRNLEKVLISILRDHWPHYKLEDEGSDQKNNLSFKLERIGTEVERLKTK